MSPPRRWRVLAAGGVAAAAVTVMMVAAPTPAGAVPAPPAGYTLTFGDDFNGAAGTRLNDANWIYDTGHGYPGGAANWGTGEVETMTSNSANVSMDGAGHLAITPLRDAAGNWTSARIETRRTDFQPPAGGKMRIEASLQQPNVSGAAAAGYWPALWSMGAPARPVGATNWPSIGEIDIMEDINGLSSVFGTLHCGPSIPGTCNETTGLGSGQVACPGCQTGFHTYGVEWDRSVNPETLRWYKDGAVYFSLNRNQVNQAAWDTALSHGYFVILNVAIGGGFPAAFGGGRCSSTTWRSTRPAAARPARRLRRHRRPGPGRTARSRPSRSSLRAAPSSRRPPTPAAARTWASSPTVTGRSTTASTSAAARRTSSARASRPARRRG
jgi:beta-glucanase (GH16 family)